MKLMKALPKKSPLINGMIDSCLASNRSQTVPIIIARPIHSQFWLE